MAFELSGFSDEIDESIVKQFSHLNKLGIKYFEPRGINGKNIKDLTDAEVEDLHNKMKEYGIFASSIGSPIGKIGINDDFDSHLLELKRVIEIAKKIDCNFIRVFSFYIPENEKAEKYHDEVIFRMKKMASVASDFGVVLLHENEKGIYGDTAKHCKEIFDEVASDNLRAVFDPANFVQCKETTFPYAFNLLKPYIKYMHIKDAKEDGTVVPAGFGDGNIESILKELKRIDYNGFLSLEPHLGTFTGLANLEQGDEMMKLNKSTTETFTLAFNSLNKIIERI